MSKDMNRIKAVCAETKHTNLWLTHELKKDVAPVSKWCTNTSQPSLEALYQIEECLNVDVKDFLNSSINDDIQLVRFVKQ